MSFVLEEELVTRGHGLSRVGVGKSEAILEFHSWVSMEVWLMKAPLVERGEVGKERRCGKKIRRTGF